MNFAGRRFKLKLRGPASQLNLVQGEVSRTREATGFYNLWADLLSYPLLERQSLLLKALPAETARAHFLGMAAQGKMLQT